MGGRVSQLKKPIPTSVAAAAAHDESDSFDDDSEDELYTRKPAGPSNDEATWLLDQKNPTKDGGPPGDLDAERVPEEEKPKYPKSVFFIMGNEFCERFSYYGMRSVLTLYLVSVLHFSDSMATVIYHTFTMLCYFTPLFGAILSDTKLGKFKTIAYVSIIYALGNIVLSIAALTNLKDFILAMSLIGLVLIAIGTGGIKPCVAAFGGDQFAPNQEKERQQFFSIFYFSINAGSLISTFVTPILRADVKCFDQETCFPLAFGVPAILMIVSLLLFVAGKSLYKINPPQGTVVIDVVKCTAHALGQRMSSKSEKREHWLDYADDRFDKGLIDDVKGVMRVLYMFLPLPFFWALFDQQGSRWTLQANKMDGTFAGTSFTLKPDQIQVINPMFILILIPIFETIVYPLFAKCRLLRTPLQRLSVGGILAGAAFVIAGFVQLALEATIPEHPPATESQFRLVNTMPCPMTVNMTTAPYVDFATLEAIPPFSEHSELVNINHLDGGHVPFHAIVTYNCTGTNISPGSIEYRPVEEKAFTLFLGLEDEIVKGFWEEESRHKADKGKSDVKLVYNVKDFPPNATITLNSTSSDGKNYVFTIPDNQEFNALDKYQLIEPDEYYVYIPDYKNPSKHLEKPSANIKTAQGAAYSLLVYARRDDVNVSLITVVDANSMSMLWQVPQYLVITIGELMFSVTGLEFAYSQSPESMKSVLQAAWLLTVAFGNLIVVIVAEAEFFEKQSYEFFLFAGLMVVDMIIFIIMSLSYIYVKSPSEQEKDALEYNEKKQVAANGATNPAFEDDTQM